MVVSKKVEFVCVAFSKKVEFVCAAVSKKLIFLCVVFSAVPVLEHHLKSQAQRFIANNFR